MAVRIQFRRGTAAEWTAANPTLAAGELGFESDTGAFKIGNGSSAWTALPYGAVSESYVDDAIANVVGLAPETLDTLNELAAAIGDDPNFLSGIADDIATAISDHNAETDVHGIPNTADLETQSGAQSKANAAQANAAAYTDNAIANLVDSAPTTLNTLNELAAALGDDSNFANTVTTALGSRIQYVVDTSANYELENDVIPVNTFAIESDTGAVKIGDGVSVWNSLSYIGQDYSIALVDLHANSTSVHGIANTMELVTESTLESAIGIVNNTIATLASNVYVNNIQNTLNEALTTHAETTTNVHGIADTSVLVTSSQMSNTIALAISDHNAVTTNVHGIANTTALVFEVSNNVSRISDAENSIATISNSLSRLDVVENSITSITEDISDLAPLNSPTFSGNVSLPVNTEIGTVTSTEIGYLSGVTGALQPQIDGKLDSAVASTTYAPLSGAEFTGNVILTANTTIGLVDSTEISYLNGVTSAIQDQLDDKAPIESPTFTGTVSGITATMVGLGSVDNTSDLDKPVSNAVQTALDLKANLANPVFTGEVEAADVVITGNLVVQGATTTVSANDLKLRDNMIYLNQAGMSTITGAVGDGTNVVYTTADAHGYQVSDFVTITGITPTSFNISGDGEEIIAVTSNTFTVASTVTDTYTSGGTARGKVHFNPDLGWAAGRYDTVNGSGYAHAGLFRDATDGVFKFFDGYVPEPDESVFIDTSDNTFALADVAVADITATNVNANAVVFGDGTTQTSAGVPSLTQFSTMTSSFTLDSVSKKDGVYEINSSSPVTVTIPTNANLAWPIGASVDILQVGTGQVTISPAAGVTLNYTPGNKLRTQWSSCTIMKRGTDSWILYGDLTA